jgi:hypothetical protein
MMHREELVERLRKLTFNSVVTVAIGLMDAPVALRPEPFSGEPMLAYTRKLTSTDIVEEFQREIELDLTLLPPTVTKYGIFIYKILGNLVRYAKITQENHMSQFSEDIKKFNGIYKLPVAQHPTLTAVGDPVARLKAFKDILAEELSEIDAVIEKVELAVNHNPESDVAALTELADLLGDIQVYCASEMAKFGLPLDEVLAVIMNSNFSKLGADGNPIYDERGKVQKGPNYWKPEPAIHAMLAEKLGRKG